MRRKKYRMNNFLWRFYLREKESFFFSFSEPECYTRLYVWYLLALMFSKFTCKKGEGEEGRAELILPLLALNCEKKKKESILTLQTEKFVCMPKSQKAQDTK